VKLLDVHEIRNMGEALARPSPLDQLLAHEPARHDEPVNIGVVELKQPVDQCFDHDQAAQR
jgi:hypothetical protein